MTKPVHPYFSFFPGLPISKTLSLGDWCIGRPDDGVSWRSSRFKELALLHLKAFTKEGYKDGALMWHRDRGFDGTIPEPHIWAAIRATICFVALDANDHVRDDLNAAYYIVTSENAELYTQPIDEEKGYITRQQGGLLKRVLSGGWKIGEEMVSLPDAVVAVSQPVVPSQRLATALFEALLDTSKPINRRIEVALEWHRFALSNPGVVSWQQRLISLKTGFEALSGESKTHECARFLRKLFENTTRHHTDLLPWAGILWSPRERTDLARTWMKGGVPQPVVRSELEDWFTALGEARNEIIHQGTFSTGIYEAPPERPLSRYTGQLFWTADRLLRETIKALLGVEVLLCARLKEAEESEKFVAVWRAMIAEVDAQAMERQEATAEVEPDDVETASPEPEDDFSQGGPESGDLTEDPVPVPAESSSRDLPMLLAALKCDAANKVRLEKLTPLPSATLEDAEEDSKATRRFWGASFNGRSMMINRAERDILVAAGAEFPLPRYWSRCE